MSIDNNTPTMIFCDEGHVWDVSTVKADRQVIASIGYCIKPMPDRTECGARVVWINPDSIDKE